MVCSARLREQLGGVVDLGEPVELVAGDVEQQRVGGLDRCGELQGMRLVELEDRHVGVEPAAAVGSSPSIEEMTPRVKLLPVRVGEDAQAVARAGSPRASWWWWSCRSCRSRRRSRRGQPGQRVGEEAGVNPLGHQPRQGRPTAPQPRRGPRRLACRDGGRRPQHPQTLTVEPPPDPLRARRVGELPAPRPPIRRPASTNVGMAPPGTTDPHRRPDVSRRRGRRRGRASRPSRRRPRRSRRGTRPPAAGCAAGRWAAPRRRR